MKKTATNLIGTLIASTILLASCLGDDTTETALESTVALLTFSIDDLRTVHTIQTDEGEDSTYTTIMSGSAIQFAIDQENQQVYNTDSIAYGTDVTKVTVNVTSDGYTTYLKEDEEGNLVESSTEDSIDFTNPVVFRVRSYDGLYTRDYVATLRKHQVDPNKTHWQQADANFAAGLFVEQKAFIKDKQLYVLGNDAEGICHMTVTTLPDATTWSTPVPCTGITGTADCSAAMLVGDTWYMTAADVLYSSTDATAWTPLTTNMEQSVALLASEMAEGTTLWGVTGNGFVSSTDMNNWEMSGQRPTKGIRSGVAAFNDSLRSNGSIKRSLFVALPTEENDTCAQVWSKLSTEAKWVEIEPKGKNTYGCPHLENLTVIRYAGKMVAFGGRNAGTRKVPLTAYGACYTSIDNGVTWQVDEKAFTLSKAFAGRIDNCSAATDGEHVWIMWSGSGEVWRGRWNGIK